MSDRRRGRPAGLLINPEAVADILDGKRQAAWANRADVSPAHLSEMLAGRKGATPDVAQRLAEAAGCRVGTLFPELVQFRTQVRHFIAPAVDEAVA